MPLSHRLVSPQELATWPEWRLMNRSPIVSNWMTPVCPTEPCDPVGESDLDESLLTGLTAVSLDAAYAAHSELRAMMAPPVKAAPNPLSRPESQRGAQSIPPPSPDGDLVDSRSILYVPVHYDADEGLLCFARFDMIHAQFPNGWPPVHRGVLSTVTHESLVVGPQPGGLLCTWWQSCANRAMRTAACNVFLRAHQPGGSTTLLFSFRQLQMPAGATPTHLPISVDSSSSTPIPFSPAVTPPRAGANAMSHALVSWLSLAQGVHGVAQLPSPVLGDGVRSDEVATGRQTLLCSSASMRQLLVAATAGRIRSRVRHVGPPRPWGGCTGGGDERRGRQAVDARPIAPRPGPVGVAQAASGLRFPCPEEGCRYATSRRFNLGVHMRKVRQRGHLIVAGRIASG